MNKKTIASMFSFVALLVPTVAFGADLIPCGDLTVPGGHTCGFNDVMELANRIVHFLMFSVAVPLAAIGFMFSGAKLVLNQDKEHAWSETKESFGNILWGFVIILGSYVLIKVILYNFLNTDAGFTLFLIQ